MELWITVAVGTVGGLLGRKLRLPVGAMTGSLMLVIAVKLILDWGWLPGQTKLILQILSGALIGSRVSGKDIDALKRMWLPGAVLVAGMIGMNLISAFIMSTLSPLDYVTAYFASAPGGLQDMALISVDFGADTFVVSICQVCRVLFILTVYPWLYRLIHTNKLYPHCGSKGLVEEKGTDTVRKQEKKKNCQFLATALIAAMGGLLFRRLGVTAGALLGSLLFTAGWNVHTQKAYVPDHVKLGLQIMTGTYVGMQVSRDTVSAITVTVLPMLIMLTVTTVLIYLLALLIQRVSKLDFMTCLLICTPGGLQEMCLLADDMECDAPKIVLMHTVRIIIVVSLCPLVLKLVSGL